MNARDRILDIIISFMNALKDALRRWSSLVESEPHRNRVFLGPYYWIIMINSLKLMAYTTW